MYIYIYIYIYIYTYICSIPLLRNLSLSKNSPIHVGLVVPSNFKVSEPFGCPAVMRYPLSVLMKNTTAFAPDPDSNLICLVHLWRGGLIRIVDSSKTRPSPY